VAFSALRALVLDLNLTNQVGSVPATVARPAPDDAPIATRGIWVTSPLEESRAYGQDFQRRDPRRVFVMPKSAVPTLPRGTIVTAAEVEGGTSKTWRVDGLDALDVPEQWRAIVIEKA
jgi:hypothetical protein